MNTRSTFMRHSLRTLATVALLATVLGTAAALMHILMGVTVSPAVAAQKGFVHEAVKGKALDRAMEIARRLATHTPESVGYIKRLVRGAVATPRPGKATRKRRLPDHASKPQLDLL